MAELYTFRPLFPGNSEIDQLFKICSVLGTPDRVSTHNNYTFSANIALDCEKNKIFLQSDWSEGFQLAENMNFTFPHFIKTELSVIVVDASQTAIRLMEDMLRWNPIRRPTAQQSLRNPYFQIGSHKVTNIPIQPNSEIIANIENETKQSLIANISATHRVPIPQQVQPVAPIIYNFSKDYLSQSRSQSRMTLVPPDLPLREREQRPLVIGANEFSKKIDDGLTDNILG